MDGLQILHIYNTPYLPHTAHLPKTFQFHSADPARDGQQARREGLLPGFVSTGEGTWEENVLVVSTLV